MEVGRLPKSKKCKREGGPDFWSFYSKLIIECPYSLRFCIREMFIGRMENEISR